MYVTERVHGYIITCKDLSEEGGGGHVKSKALNRKSLTPNPIL